jgi:hypothetical protein
VCENWYHCADRTDWQSLQCSLAVLVVWFVSHLTFQCAHSEISQARNIKYVNKVIILNQNRYYKYENWLSGLMSSEQCQDLTEVSGQTIIHKIKCLLALTDNLLPIFRKKYICPHLQGYFSPKF